MAESNIFGVFGIKAFVPVNKTTGVPYGRYRVLGGAELSLESDKVELRGGANRYSWATEYGAINAELALTIREYPEFAFQLHLQGTTVISSAETGGTAGTLANKSGTSVVNATNGIASIGVLAGSEADLKTGKYIVEAVGTATVDVYYIGSEYDSYQDDYLKITSSPLNVEAGGGSTVTITGFGLEFTLGTGSGLLTVNETAEADVRKINTGNHITTIGQANIEVKEFKAFLFGEDQKDGNQVYIEIDRCSGVGLPLSFAEKEFSETEVTMNIDYSVADNRVFKIFKIFG